MEFREVQQSDIDYMTHNSINGDLKQLRAIDYIYTLEHNGIPLLVGGFRLITDTTAWCWVDISHEAGNHTVTMYRTIKEWINNFVETHNIKRLQAFTRPDSEESIRMLKHLGFKPESAMVGFFEDGDALLFVRLI